MHITFSVTLRRRHVLFSVRMRVLPRRTFQYPDVMRAARPSHIAPAFYSYFWVYARACAREHHHAVGVQIIQNITYSYNNNTVRVRACWRNGRIKRVHQLNAIFWCCGRKWLFKKIYKCACVSSLLALSFYTFLMLRTCASMLFILLHTFICFYVYRKILEGVLCVCCVRLKLFSVNIARAISERREKKKQFLNTYFHARHTTKWTHNAFQDACSFIFTF